MSMMCFPVCGSPDRRRAVVLVDDDADVTFADASDVFFDARDAFDARASALSSDQPMMRDVEDDHDDDDGTFAALSRASERMERESRSNLAARARATATAIKAVLNAAASKKSIDLTSFLGTPIRWCSRYSVLRIATDSVSPISKDMPSRTFRMFEMLRRIRVDSTAEERFLGALGAFIAECEPPRSLKKPLNPVLGETAMHTITFADGSSFECVWEQVSHHPPVTANFARGPTFVVAGNVQPKPRLVGAHIDVALDGYVQFVIPSRGNETYEASMPTFEWRFLPRWYARMKPNAPVTFACARTGFRAELTYGTKYGCHRIKGAVYALGAGNGVVYTIDGRYDGEVVATPTTRADKAPKTIYDANEFLRIGQSGRTHEHWMMVKRHDDPRDSDTVWRECFEAMDRNDWDAARAAKKKVEDDERVERRARAERGDIWRPKYFAHEKSTGRWVRNDVPTMT